tara:strand:+ start:278 stop:481 length:204 start_codon:yes stop_codon:yes gene_type:complete
MPQIYALGGMPIQKIPQLRVDVMKNTDQTLPYIEINYSDMSVLLRNISTISSPTGNTINVEKIIYNT